MENTKELKEILKREVTIPIYQREYEWEADEINEFIEDFMRIYEDVSDNKSHFFGQMVFHNDKVKNLLNIIDGQQRLITVTLLINNIRLNARDLYDNVLNTEQNKKIREELDHIKAECVQYVGDEKGFHLHSDNSFIEKVLNKTDKKDDYANKVNKRIKKCDELMERLIEEIISEDENVKVKVTNLSRMLNIISNKFIIIPIETTDLEEAFVIFETLNARGKNLSTADLLKNFLFGKSGSKIDLTKKKWDSMMDKLDQIDVTTFIRHYWNSKEKFSRKTELYSKLVKKINSYEDVKEFMDDLDRNAIVYASINEPFTDNSCFKNNEIKESLNNLKALNATTFYPVILSLKSHKYEEKYILEVVRALENFIFRNYTICGKNPNNAEGKFATIATQIDNELKSVDDIIEKIVNEKVDEKEFAANFSRVSIKNKAIIRYIFNKIHKYYAIREINENESNKKEITELEIDIRTDNNVIHIEHIMPIEIEKWQKDDQEYTDAFHKEYLWKLGNLALLGKEYNQDISNNIFAEKKDTYSSSMIRPNREIAEFDEWKRTQIEKRQCELAEAAKKIWSENGITLYSKNKK